MLKKAKFWREFTAATRAEAEQAAAAWWAGQSGLDRISGWILPAGDPGPGATAHWTATIVYKPADSEQGQPTIH